MKFPFHPESKIAKSVSVYIITSFLQKAVSLISGPIFTRILSIKEYGYISIFNSWIDVIGVVAMLSLSAGVYSNGMVDFSEDRDIFTFSLLILSNIVTGILFIFFLAFRNVILSAIDISFDLICLMFLVFFFSPSMSFWMARQRYEYRYKTSGIIAVVSSVLVFVFTVLAVVFINEPKVKIKLFTEKVALMFFWVCFYILIAYRAKLKIKTSYWLYALRFNIPLIPHYLSLYVLHSSDRIMVGRILDIDSAAIYSVAVSAASIITLFWQSINAAILPYMYENLKLQRFEKVKLVAIPFILLYGLLCIAICFIVPELFFIFAPKRYDAGILLIPPLLCGIFFSALYCLFANVEFYYKSTKFIMINSIVAGLINIMLNLFFIPYFGFIGAAYTTLFTNIVQTVLHYVNYKRIVQKDIYNMWILVSISIGIIIICLSIQILYAYTVVRYILFLFLCFIIVKKGAPLFSKISMI